MFGCDVGATQIAPFTTEGIVLSQGISGGIGNSTSGSVITVCLVSLTVLGATVEEAETIVAFFNAILIEAHKTI